MSQTEDLLSDQIATAELLLKRVASLPAGSRSGIVAGLIKYDDSLTCALG